jgi:hypothetical protein
MRNWLFRLFFLVLLLYFFNQTWKIYQKFQSNYDRLRHPKIKHHWNLQGHQTEMPIVKKGIKTLHFHGGGIFFWWQAGTARFLLEKGILDHPSIEFVGASAGAITISLMIANADFKKAAQIAMKSVNDLDLQSSSTGLLGIWGDILFSFLNELILPANISSDHLSRIHIAVTPKFIFHGPKYLDQFKSKKELIHAVMTSTHIPFFMDGSPWRTVEDEHFVDGNIWQFILKKRLPFPETIIAKKPELKKILHKSSERSENSEVSSARPTVSGDQFLSVSGDENNVIIESSSGAISEIINQEGNDSDDELDEVSVLSFDINYKDDQQLMAFAEDIHIVKLITPETLFKMMDLGYQYMEREWMKSYAVMMDY